MSRPFDEARYKTLLDGLEVTEIRLSEILQENNTFRLDSEHFKKEYLGNIEIIKNYSAGFVTLGSCTANITGGATPLGAEYLESGVGFLRVQNVMYNYMNDSDMAYISEADDLDLRRSKLNADDVLLTITGVSYGKSSVVTKKFEGCNINQHSVKITLKDDTFSPYFISTFLNAKSGKLQSDQNIVGVTRPALDYETIKNFRIPLVSKDFQKQIEKTVKAAHVKLEASKSLYAQAEATLLDELGLKNWKPSKESAAIKSFKESFGKSGRLDAEYYQPKYDALLRSINKSGYPVEKLGSLVQPIKNGFDSREYTEEGTPYIRVGDVRNGRIDIESAVKIPIENTEVDKDVSLNLGDVLFTRKGSFGNAAVVREDALHTIISSEIMLLRLLPEKNKTILPDYLALYLNSKLGFMQVERRVHGVAYYSISQPDLATVEIAIPPKPVQTRIAKGIQDSLSALQESKRLLEVSKRAVEVSIEKGEKAGMKVLE